ncbi:hypothetical protein JW835_04535 [bacterium]|nr:hypothetical protein [bacterium]
MNKCFYLLIFFPLFLFTQTDKPWLDYEFPSVIADNDLWIGTPNGLYQYHDAEDSWSLYGTHNGLPDDRISILRWDNEYLWVSTPKGLAQGDIRLNKWIIHTKESGLPSDDIFSIEFQEDYVWIVTDQGAARYDKLIEEWEIFDTSSGLPDTLIFDLAVNDELVYFGSAQGLAEYDVNFEKWRYFGRNEGLPSDTIRYIYQTTENLYLFTPAGPCRFNKQLHSIVSFASDPRLNYANIRYFFVLNDQFWVATGSDVLIYDPNSNAWREYHESVFLPDQRVNGMSISQEFSWFVTPKGIARLDEKNKTWQRYDRTHGLSSELYDRVFTFRGKVFLINNQTIDYYKSSENRWYNHPRIAVSSQKKEHYPNLSLDREQGSYIELNDWMRLSLNGTRITSVLKSQNKYDLKNQTWSADQQKGNRIDFKSQFSLGKDRTLNSFYNNVDETQVMYGIRYRGAQHDPIQEVTWGDVRFERGRHQFLTSGGIFGGSARIEAGPKTEQYKRSLVSLNACGGERTTGTEIEFLTGNIKSGQFSKRDIDYLKGCYFALDTTEGSDMFTAGEETLYLDDKTDANNDENTQPMVLSGISGHYDRLHPIMDYTLDSKGIICLVKPISKNATLIAEIGQIRIILQGQEHTTELKNHYSLGVRDILPYNFNFTITDTLGRTHAMHEFGLDTNKDGIIDPEWIDYHLGILTFPLKEPFPQTAYMTDPVSSFIMEYTFQTELGFFTLKHDSLIRGSEILLIDGEILTPGQDYVLDYTAGTLIIIKEGILAEDSEIQIEYEYYQNTGEQFHMAGFGIGPSDNILLVASGYRFDQSAGLRENQVDGLNVLGEFKGRIKSWNFKLTPEFAKTSLGHISGNSLFLRSDISASRLRLFGLVERIDPEFQSLLPKQFQLGDLRHHLKSGLTLYPFQGLDMTGLWQRQTAQPSETGYQNQETNVSAKMLFSRKPMPALSVSIRDQQLDTESRQTRKQTMKGEIEYVVPDHFLKRIRIKSLHVFGVWRHSREKYSGSAQNSCRTFLYDNHYFRLDFSPADQIQINGYFRDRIARLADFNFNPIQTLNQKQKTFIDAIVDRLDGVNMNIRYQGEIQEFSPLAYHTQQIILYRRLESSIRIYPGQWISDLSPFTLQISVQPFWQGTMRNVNQPLSLTKKFWATSGLNGLSSCTDNNHYQIRGEWRPSPEFLFYSRYDYQTIVTISQKSRFDTRINRFNQKIEIRPAMNTQITVQYFRTLEDKINYSNTIRDNPMLWIDKRWNERLQTKFNMTYWREIRCLGNKEEHTQTLSPLLGLTYRFYNRDNRTHKGEIRNDFSASFYRKKTTYADQAQNTFSNQLSLDLYPASVFILRGRWSVTYVNLLNSDMDRIDHLIELRLTAQF